MLRRGSQQKSEQIARIVAQIENAIGDPIEIKNKCIENWTLDVEYWMLPRENGPVAQRLEQGTHNSRQSFCAVLSVLPPFADARCFGHSAFALRYATCAVLQPKILRP